MTARDAAAASAISALLGKLDGKSAATEPEEEYYDEEEDAGDTNKPA